MKLLKDAVIDARILVIDDEPEVAEAIREGLRISGITIHVDAAGNAADGLRQVLKSPPDVIILDLKMPRGSGFDFIDQLKQTKSTPHMRIIMLTALATGANEWRSIDYQIHDFVA